ncbi:MAG: CvpA family protein [Lachnospiraceae bacterium]|nr:CvpA family protein [Lachnospiraceae bacterium]
MEARIAECVALGLVLLSVFDGATKGLVLKVYSMVRFVLMIVVTMVLVPLLMPLIPSDVVAKEGIAFLAALVIAGVGLSVVANLLKIIDYIPVVNKINKFGGALLGLVCGLLLVWVVLLAVGAFQEMQWCRNVAEYVKQSPVLMFIQTYNPLPIILKNFNFPII